MKMMAVIMNLKRVNINTFNNLISSELMINCMAKQLVSYKKDIFIKNYHTIVTTIFGLIKEASEQ